MFSAKKILTQTVLFITFDYKLKEAFTNSVIGGREKESI